VLGCAPTTLTNRDTLRLRLGPQHGSELAITRLADKTPYFLVVQGAPVDMQSLMSPQEFATATLVEIGTSTTGYRWIAAGGPNEKIFTRPGKYLVTTSTALESERGGYECSLDYVG
jgi:hypothetical protein